MWHKHNLHRTLKYNQSESAIAVSKTLTMELINEIAILLVIYNEIANHIHYRHSIYFKSYDGKISETALSWYCTYRFYDHMLHRSYDMMWNNVIYRSHDAVTSWEV